MTRPPHVVKNDDGDGRGSDLGYGFGDGWDYGYGFGDGDGDGYGDGNGNGDGYGDGSGSGETGRWLDTSHPHITIGWHKLKGGVAPYKTLQ